ncbi:hypothetical protein CLIB1423_02S10418 [[Candida] railenensis]|uniref:Uncharacterized protein n=1 Tax=[Candida] railenensis TaxID=45579 RepID=A0A9P0VWK2_9ASCO|nr:hypothetical protein CLIB1423_02S10418 [[Candida] railenensis]
MVPIQTTIRNDLYTFHSRSVRVSMVTEYLEQLRNGQDGHNPISKLADQLRDEKVRGSEEIFTAIPELSTLFSKYMNMNVAYQSNILRLMINLSADNEKNRNSLIESDIIWNTVLQKVIDKDLDQVVLDRIFIFLTQFIRNTEQSQDHATFFRIQGLDKIIMSRIESFVQHFAGISHNAKQFTEDAVVDDYLDQLGNELELYVEMSKGTSFEWDEYDLVTFLRLFMLVLKVDFSDYNPCNSKDSSKNLPLEEDDYEEERENVLLLLSDIIMKLSSVDDMNKNWAVTCQNFLLLIMKEEYKISSIHTKRQIFASSGNISSIPSFDNWLVAEDCIRIIYGSFDESPGTYQVAASCIILGNCVDSITSRQKLLEGITYFASSSSSANINGKAFVGKICHALSTFNDVVQFQAIHLLVNIMTEELSKQLFYIQDNFSALYKASKVILDNKSYYQEISKILIKLIKKFIKAFPQSLGIDLLEKVEFWTLFANLEDDDTVLLLVLQKVIQNKRISYGSGKQEEDEKTIYKLLFQNMVKPVESVNLDSLLEKLKTLAMAFQCDNISKVLDGLYTQDNDAQQNALSEKILAPYLKFLDSLYTLLQKPESATSAILLNNSKFVAATTKQYTGILGENSKIVEICDEILKL